MSSSRDGGHAGVPVPGFTARGADNDNHHHGDGDVSSIAPSDNTDGDHILEKPTSRASARETAKKTASEGKKRGLAHVKAKWKWYLLALILFLAILLPIVFLVILPAIVQLIVNTQGLPILGGALTIVTPNEIKINLDSTFQSPIPAYITPFAMMLYDNSRKVYEPFLRLDLPTLHISGPTMFHIDDQVQPIINQAEVTRWLGQYFDGDEVTLGVRGIEATIMLGALKSQPRLDKSVTFKGLNQLKGLTVTTINVLFPAEKGVNIRGDLMLPNWSPLSVGLGDVVFGIQSGELDIGSISVRNVALKPGNNTLSFEGFLDIPKIVGNLGGFLSSQAEALGAGNVRLNVTGKSAMVNGEHIKFLEDVLGSRILSTDISVVTVLASVLGGLFKSGGNITGNGPANGTTFIDTLSKVFSNQTLLSTVVSHWGTGTEASKADADRAKRSLMGDSAAWQLLKLGLQMKAMGK